eukprot:5351509-Pyramimonas_sp.AAC.3
MYQFDGPNFLPQGVGHTETAAANLFDKHCRRSILKDASPGRYHHSHIDVEISIDDMRAARIVVVG